MNAYFSLQIEVLNCVNEVFKLCIVQNRIRLSLFFCHECVYIYFDQVMRICVCKGKDSYRKRNITDAFKIRYNNKTSLTCLVSHENVLIMLLFHVRLIETDVFLFVILKIDIK